MFKHLPFLTILVVMAVLYIANGHKAERKIRHIQELKESAKEMRWEYVSMHSQMMQSTTQSHTADKVEKLGLKWGASRPIIIVDKK